MPTVTDRSGVAYEPWATLLAPGEVQVQRQVARGERAAGTLLCYQNAIVSGLLQTRAYARAIMAEAHTFHDLPESEIDAATDARIARQAILTEEPSRVFWFVLAESALWPQMADTQAMDAQLTHLAAVASAGIQGVDARLGIVPRSAPWRHAQHGFNIHEGDGYSQASEETIAGTLTVTDHALVAVYRKVFQTVSQMAVYGDDAAQVIENVRGEL